MRKNVLLGMIGAALLLGVPTTSLAVTGTSGTTAGVDIISGGDAGAAGTADVSGDVVATFKVGGNGTKNTTCVIATVTVGQVYGGKWGTLTDDQNGIPDTMVDYGYELINLGNATGVFGLSCNTNSLPTGWNAAILKNEATIGSLTVAEDAMATFTVRVTIPALANDKDKGTITVIASTINDGIAYVVGNWQYGGEDTLIDDAVTTCNSAIIVLTKTASVQNPSGYNGNNINVPGSLVTYCLEYRNTGSAVANDVTVTDMIPRHTTYVAGSIKMGTDGSTYAGATTKTDAVDVDAAQFSASVVQFNLGTVAAGISGRLYYQVRID